MSGQMDRWTNGWIDGQTDSEEVDKWLRGRMDWWVHQSIDELVGDSIRMSVHG